MPHMPARRCSTCRQLVTGRRCQTCTRQADARRGSAHDRGYTARWTRFSKLWRQRFPLCGMRADGQRYAEHSRCVQAGLTRRAECVDHIDGHSRADDRETFYDSSRLQSLCLDCNRVKAIEHEGGFGRSQTGAANGLESDQAQDCRAVQKKPGQVVRGRRG